MKGKKDTLEPTMIQMTKETFLNPSEYFLQSDNMEYYVSLQVFFEDSNLFLRLFLCFECFVFAEFLNFCYGVN
jgi:hypothetical protein